MSPIILLCALLLAFSTGSPVPIAEQPRSLPDEQASLEDFRRAIITASERVECPTLFVSRLVALAQVAERCWSACLDKIAAYSDNQDFFKTTLPAFIDEVIDYPAIKPPLKYSDDATLLRVKIIFEKSSFEAFLTNFFE